MFSSLRRAKGAGYRAGRAGASFTVNPFSNQGRPLLSSFWGEGWEKGIKERIAEPLPFIVEMELASGSWENVWTVDGETQTYSSREEAQAAIEEHVEECQYAFEQGYMSDAPIMQDFRVRQLGKEI